MSDYIKEEEKLKRYINEALEEWEANHDKPNWDPDPALTKYA
jgi:hypothetical protein